MITLWTLDQTRLIEVLATPKNVPHEKYLSLYSEMSHKKRNADTHIQTERQMARQTGRDEKQDL